MAKCDVPGASMHYEQFGEGHDVVWVAGGGSLGSDWHKYQMPFFEPHFRNTTFDNRGIGQTTCDEPMPWPLEKFSADTIALIEKVCEPPVSLVGISFGSAIAQQVAIDRPDLVRSAVVMGTGSRSIGWGWDFQEAEIELRKAGGRLDGMFAVTHYAAMLYPAKVLGDRELWPKLRTDLEEWLSGESNEESLIPQWESCLLYDQTAQLPGCQVPMHVVAFAEDIQAPPQDGQELAEQAGNGIYQEFAGMGHGSIYGHTHDVLNPWIKATIEGHV
ncbi:MAG: alpha/beta hydrolase [Actinomycetia bacterium]|nr:alpha/beta hydrolase [Actinomycetes bacterium]